jgi:peptidoglycan/LPS O-acetylase OafA/YrhL
VLIAGHGHTLAVWLTNLIGLLGGFGWEAVSALVLISGFSLRISQRSTARTRAEWFGWYRKRARRILVPFYIAAAFFLTFYALAAAVLPHLGGRFAGSLATKLFSQFHTPLPGVLASHLLLFDPYNRFWSADFLAPAWWFVPAILLAYAIYPFVTAAAGRAPAATLLAAAGVTVAAYAAAGAGLLWNETWYYIVLQESFNFTLGIVVATLWLSPKRALLERCLNDPRVFAAAVLAFAIGNVANWSDAFRPVASMLYGPGLTLMLAFLGGRLARAQFAATLTRVDPYDLYLVHQPFAFPLALLAGTVLHQYAVFAGWFVFVAVSVLAANVLGRAHGAAFAFAGKTAPADAGRRFAVSGKRIA